MNQLTPRLGVAALSSPLEVGADRADTAAAEVTRRLESAGCHCINAGTVNTPEKATAAGRRFAESHVQAVVLVAVCWFEDYLVLDLLEESPLPLLLWSLPGMETGALCGTQQLTFALRQLDVSLARPFSANRPTPSLEATRLPLRACRGPASPASPSEDRPGRASPFMVWATRASMRLR